MEIARLTSPRASVMLYLIGYVAQRTAARHGGLLAPPGERFMRAGDCFLDAPLARLLELPDHLGRRVRVDALERHRVISTPTLTRL